MFIKPCARFCWRARLAGSRTGPAQLDTDGCIVLLTVLSEGQKASVLHLPAQPKTEVEAREQKRVGFVGPSYVRPQPALVGQSASDNSGST